MLYNRIDRKSGHNPHEAMSKSYNTKSYGTI